MKTLTKILLFSLILLIYLPCRAQTGTLKLLVKNIKDHKGTIHAFLWDKAEGFPKEKDLFAFHGLCSAKADSVTIIFSDIPFHEYAISIFQDVNDNKEFDKNRLYRTMEPFGLSGKPDFTHRPVKFDDCKFELVTEKLRLIIPLMYKEDLEIYF